MNTAQITLVADAAPASLLDALPRIPLGAGTHTLSIVGVTETRPDGTRLRYGTNGAAYAEVTYQLAGEDFACVQNLSSFELSVLASAMARQLGVRGASIGAIIRAGLNRPFNMTVEAVEDLATGRTNYNWKG